MDVREYLRQFGFSEKQIDKQLQKRIRCKHKKKFINQLKEYRKNYPFGRKSKPRFSVKKTYGERCENCGEFRRGRNMFS